MLRSHRAYACKFVEFEWIRVEVLCLWSLDISPVQVYLDDNWELVDKSEMVGWAVQVLFPEICIHWNFRTWELR